MAPGLGFTSVRRRMDLLVLMLGVVILRLPTLSEPRWYSDEGTFTTVAWLVTHGVRLYQGVFDSSPPGIYWIYAGLLAAGGDRHHVVIEAGLLFAVLASVLLTYHIARRIAPGVALPAAILCAIGLSLPTLDGDLLNVEVAALPFALAALALALRGSATAAILSGILLGIALTIRPSYALDGLAIVAALLWTPRWVRNLLAAAAGGLGALGAVALTLQLQGSLGAYVAAVLPDDHAYVLAANGGSLIPLAVRVAFLAVVAILWYRRVRGTPWRVLAVWLPASLAGASVTPRGLTHYALEAAPALAIGVAALAALLIRLGHQRASIRWLAIPAAVIALIAGLEAIIILPVQETALVTGQPGPRPFLHNFSYAELPGYYARWLTSLGTEQAARAFPGPIVQEVAAADLIDRVAPDRGGRLLVLGDRAWIYFLARRDPAVRYVALNSGFRLVPGGLDEVAAAVDQHRAQIVVLADAPAGDWLGRLRADGYRQVAAQPYPIFLAPASG